MGRRVGALSETVLITQSELSWKESRVLWELRCNLEDVGGALRADKYVH